MPSTLRISVATLIAFLAAPNVFAQGFWDQFKDPMDGRFDASSYLADNAYGFLPVPIIITDPAVDGGLGAVGLFFHESEEQKEQRLKALRESENGAQFLLTPNISAAALAVTGNESWFAGGGHMGFFDQGRIRYMGGGGFGSVNLDFYGSGDVSLINPVELNTEAGAIMNSVKFKIGDSKFFIGPVQQFVSARIEPGNLGDLGGPLVPPELQDPWEAIMRDLLTQDIVTSALGIALEYDSRNNFFSPHAGFQWQLEHLWFSDEIGSDIEYQLLTFNSFNYWEFSDSFRAALKVTADYASTGSLLPPFSVPSITLRGVPALRYQGNAVIAAEAEVTWQIDPRWSVLAFAGAGRAANEIDDLDEQSTRVTKGGGFRYLIARQYGFEMGLDIAVGPEETVFYIQAGTAWR
ncbi:MAG: BamA/TamA family outer membrane protein [Woeseiaceae bacterium]